MNFDKNTIFVFYYLILLSSEYFIVEYEFHINVESIVIAHRTYLNTIQPC